MIEFEGGCAEIPTAKARERLAAIISFVQDGRNAVFLTRHGERVAAVVSVSTHQLINTAEAAEMLTDGSPPPIRFLIGPMDSGWRTPNEAAEGVMRLQMDRLMERSILSQAGLTPVPGGELMAPQLSIAGVEIAAPVPRWRRWLRAFVIWCKRQARLC